MAPMQQAALIGVTSQRAPETLAQWPPKARQMELRVEVSSVNLLQVCVRVPFSPPFANYKTGLCAYAPAAAAAAAASCSGQR